MDQNSDDCSTSSSRSRSTSEDSVDHRNHHKHQPPLQPPLQNGLLVIDPLLCSKNLSNEMITTDNKLTSGPKSDVVLKRTSLCETVAEVTENEVVSGPRGEVVVREPASKDSKTAGPRDNHVTSSEINGNHVTSNGERYNMNNSISDSSNMNNVDNCNTNGLTNGTCNENGVSDHEDSDASSIIDEEIHNNNLFLKLVDSEAEVLTKEREYFMTLVDEASAASEEGRLFEMSSSTLKISLCTNYYRLNSNLTYILHKSHLSRPDN